MKPDLILVQGMHRSGTSAVTRSLQVFGVSLGNELMPPAPDNPKGFFEDEKIQQLNEKLLSSLGYQWDDLKFPSRDEIPNDVLHEYQSRLEQLLNEKLGERTAPFAFKDPRMCRLWPLWKDTLKRKSISTAVIFVTRRPGSVALSLSRRDNMPYRHALILWRLHNLQALESLMAWSGTWVDYDDLLRDPKNVLNQIGQCLILGEPRPEAFVEYVSDFLDAGLNHGVIEKIERHAEKELIQDAEDVYRQIKDDLRAGRYESSLSLLSRPFEWEQEMAMDREWYQGKMLDLRRHTHNLQISYEKAKEYNESLELEINNLRSSYEKAKEYNESLELEINNLRSSYEKVKEYNESLRIEISILQRNANALMAKNASLMEQLVLSRKRIMALESNILARRIKPGAGYHHGLE